MAQHGQLVQWNDDRGFGFIQGGDGQRYFVHISAMGRSARRPSMGDRVSFVPGMGADGRSRAETVHILGAHPMAVTKNRRHSGSLRASGAWRPAGAAAVLILLLTAIALHRVPWQVGLIYGGMGLVSLLAYRSDKIYAEAGHWRISEAKLLGIDLCMGIAGGLVGQALFRHKTNKPRYIAATMLILGIHLLWLVAFAMGLIDGHALADMLAWIPWPPA